MVEQNDDHHNHDHQDEHRESSSTSSVVAKKRQDAHKEKLKVAITSVVASAGLAIFKIIIGFSTNSLGDIIRSFPFWT